jgi:hypothetical protein
LLKPGPTNFRLPAVGRPVFDISPRRVCSEVAPGLACAGKRPEKARHADDGRTRGMVALQASPPWSCRQGSQVLEPLRRHTANWGIGRRRRTIVLEDRHLASIRFGSPRADWHEFLKIELLRHILRADRAQGANLVSSSSWRVPQLQAMHLGLLFRESCEEFVSCERRGSHL